MNNITTDRLVNVKHLKQCELWEGSLLEISFRFGGVRLSQVVAAEQALARCDDRTKKENQWLAALQLAIKESK